MTQKPKLQWVRKDSQDVGNAFGYRTHNKYMLDYSRQYFDITDDADVALHIQPADHYRPIEGKFNVLFTMWEFLDVPKSYIKGLREADLIIVPCKFCKDLFARYTDKPIHVCWEGVDPEAFPYRERAYISGNKFRFLWVGAPNPRKGYPLILSILELAEKIPNVEIYLKTTTPKSDRREILRNLWYQRADIRKRPGGSDFIKRALQRFQQERLWGDLHNTINRHGKYKNIILDTRILSKEDLVALYHSAQCFMLPSYGEGWGLTLCEAMATGAPCISVDYTGCADFFDSSVGYPLKYSIQMQELRNYDLNTRTYAPDAQDLLKQMLHVAANYPEAVKKGNRAASRIRSKFTWEKSGRRLADILYKNVYERKAAA